MNLLRYAMSHMGRSLRDTLLTLLTYVMVLVLILSAQQSALSRQAMLDDMVKSIPVVAQLTDPQGSRSTNLQILNTDLAPYREGGRWAHFVGELNIGAVATTFANVFIRDPADQGDGEPLKSYYGAGSLVGITSERADPALENAVFTYDAGYDRTVWASMEPVCMITEDLRECVTQMADGSFIDLEFIVHHSGPGGGSEYVKLMLRVIGTVPGKKTMYTPFYYVKQEMYDQGGRYTLNTDRLSFTFSDNTLIDDFRSSVTSLYVVPDQMRPNFNFMLGLVIKDARYLQLKQEAEKNLAIFRLMQPVLYLCAVGAGVLLMVMQLRARKREMAIIRSVGCSVRRVLMQCLTEYALICLPVTALAPLIWPDMPPYAAVAVFAAFMAGAAATILRFACIPLGRQIRSLEDQ